MITHEIPLQTQHEIPGQLTELDRWVCWRADLYNGRRSKTPLNPYTGKPASVTDSRTWSDFAAARQAQNRFGCDGVGIVLSGDGLVAIDLDKCVRWNEERFLIEPWALAIVRRLNSYTEFSPSSGGLHVFAFGFLPEDGRRAGQFEMYGNKRFLTATGWRVPGSPDSIKNCSTELLSLHSQFFRPTSIKPKNLGPSWAVEACSGHRPRLGYPSNESDDALLDRARSAKNGALFRSLFDDGDISRYGADDSRADQCLCNILAFWTGKDRPRMEALFRRSALMREKWERRPDYRNRTIDAAIQRCVQTWKPRS